MVLDPFHTPNLGFRVIDIPRISREPPLRTVLCKTICIAYICTMISVPNLARLSHSLEIIVEVQAAAALRPSNSRQPSSWPERLSWRQLTGPTRGWRWVVLRYLTPHDGACVDAGEDVEFITVSIASFEQSRRDEDLDDFVVGFFIVVMWCDAFHRVRIEPDQ